MDPLTIGIGLAAKYAPDIIRYLKGEKAGDVAEKVIDIAQTVTGTATPKEAEAILAVDPAKALEFKLAVMAQQTTIEQMYLADTASARNMQIAALGQEDKFSKRFVYYFSGAWSLFAMIYFLCSTFIEVTESGQRIADTILGVLIATVMGSIFGFFYGTTKTSQVKDTTISNLVK